MACGPGRGCIIMIRAYPENYLSRAQALLGDAFDYAVNVLEMDGSAFVMLFVGSSVSRRMELGEPSYLQGKSGIDVVVDVIKETTGKTPAITLQDRVERSAEYWVGWAVAYYHWYSDRKYREIFSALPFEDLLNMYLTLHEADISKFVEIAEKAIRNHFPDTNLKRIRQMYGCTQAELAKRSGVGLRSIQMYEQRNKDINKAGVETVYRLAKVLGCSMEDLIEK